MRIAQIAPLTESVPPQLYGGTERVVCFLTDELVRQGHDVTLFASGDSRTAAALHACWPQALRLGGPCRDALAPHLLMLEEVARRAAEFDVLHFHISQFHFPLVRRLTVPHVSTTHGRLDMAELAPLYREFRDVPLVSISDAQRLPVPFAGWTATIHHGLPPDLLRFRAAPGEYLAFVGRISPEKRVDRAIAIATACRRPLKIAAKIDAADRDYFEREIRHLLDNPFVQYVGEIDDGRKADFLGRAAALLFPIDWPEPFGLVMIEALACGTPVVAFRGGSVAEIIEDGVTGFVVDSLEDAIAATARIDALDRRRCRDTFDRRFTVSRMARDYVATYEQVISRPAARATLSGVA
jgi:glycosyltransferase involved in cell wall biosynthesis